MPAHRAQPLLSPSPSVQHVELRGGHQPLRHRRNLQPGLPQRGQERLHQRISLRGRDQFRAQQDRAQHIVSSGGWIGWHNHWIVAPGGKQVNPEPGNKFPAQEWWAHGWLRGFGRSGRVTA